jgi:magnesium transporter
MITSYFHAPDGSLRGGLTAAETTDALLQPGGLLWVNIEVNERAEAEPLLRDVFRFHPLSIDDCFNTLIDPPKIDDFGEYLFVITHDVTYDAVTKALRTAELDMYIGENYVVSVHRLPIAAVEEMRRRIEASGPLFSHGADFLAHALFDIVVDGFHPVVEALDDEVADIEERVIDQPERALLEEVLRLKRTSQRLRRSILPQRDVAIRFSRGEFPRLIKGDALMYFRDVYDHTVRVGEMIDSVRDLADSALNTYLSSVNNRINEVMKTLAIVTVVFLPLTLIAGIYGTNFENVPEYGTRFGYAGMLSAMVVLAAALIGWFRFRRWF